jgi:alginate O-acetyltransferase complex protein AlgI
MLFNSLPFFIFFPIVVSLYFIIPHRFRWLLLLLASCYFYMSFVPVYILILGTTIVVDYIAGIYIEKSSGRRRKAYLVLSIISNVGFLAFFKYFNFFLSNINQLAIWLHWNYSITLLSIILPIGLSFHTFQAMSYTIEVYRGNQKAERHFGIYALYVMFFPQLVAGPIERPQHLIHQFYERHDFNYEDMVSGLRLMAWGLFKKAVIADRLATIVGVIYHHPQYYQGISLIMGTVLFAYQLYCDFSGYTDIARGAARVMGFRLIENFNLPYYSKSMPEFWRRWHISLFSWFRDYLYYPLVFAKSNRTALWVYTSLLITFLVSGLWHGANWTYVIWGGLNGCYLIVSLVTAKFRAKVTAFLGLNKLPTFHKIIQIVITFSLWTFSLILFRANTLTDAYYIMGHLFSNLGNFFLHINGASIKSVASMGVDFDKKQVLIGAIMIVVLEIIQFFLRGSDLNSFLVSKPTVFRWTFYYALIALILIFGVFGSAQFIYFQF